MILTRLLHRNCTVPEYIIYIVHCLHKLYTERSTICWPLLINIDKYWQTIDKLLTTIDNIFAKLVKKVNYACFLTVMLNKKHLRPTAARKQLLGVPILTKYWQILMIIINHYTVLVLLIIPIVLIANWFPNDMDPLFVHWHSLYISWFFATAAQ